MSYSTSDLQESLLNLVEEIECGRCGGTGSVPNGNGYYSGVDGLVKSTKWVEPDNPAAYVNCPNCSGSGITDKSLYDKVVGFLNEL